MRSTAPTRRPRHERRPHAPLVTALSALAALTTALLVAPSAAAVPVDAAVPAVRGAGGCAPFADVDSGNVHCRNIAWLKTQHITKPRDHRFHPDEAVTRGQMAAFLFRLVHHGAKAPACTGGQFTDVGPGNVFCGYISWASDHGIASGYPDHTYRSGRAVTRGAMAAFLHRITDPGGGTPACNHRPFRDVATSNMFCGVITWMRHDHIAAGYPDETYRPNSAVTRGAMASFLHRVAGDVADVGSIEAQRPAASPPAGNGPPPEQDYASSGADHAVTGGILAAVNKIRSAVGAAPLRISSTLERYALRRSAQQADANLMSHAGFSGINPPLFGAGYTALAENVAYNFPTPAAAVRGWRHSEGHYKNMIGRSYTDVGVAVAYSSSGHPYYTMLLAG